MRGTFGRAGLVVLTTADLSFYPTCSFYMCTEARTPSQPHAVAALLNVQKWSRFAYRKKARNADECLEVQRRRHAPRQGTLERYSLHYKVCATPTCVIGQLGQIASVAELTRCCNICIGVAKRGTVPRPV